MGARAEGGQRFRWPSWLGPAIVYGISIACLVWVYRDFDWKTELPRLRTIHWSWITLAVICDVSVYICQAWRWNLVLAPVTRIPLGRSVRAIYIGLFANEALPLRSGEAVRCYLQSHWSNIPFTTSVSSALIERMFDGVWLILGFLVVGYVVNLPEKVQAGVWVLAALVGALGALIAFAVLHRERTHATLSRNRVVGVLRHLVEGLHTMGRSRSFYLAAAASIPYLALQVVPIHAMMRGYGLDLSFSSAAIVLVVLRLGTVIPGPPSNIGIFNAFAMLGLTLLGVDKQTAKGLSGMMFFVITVPLLIGGTIALAATGLNIQEIQKRAHFHLRRVHKTPVGTHQN